MFELPIYQKKAVHCKWEREGCLWRSVGLRHNQELEDTDLEELQPVKPISLH